MWKTEIMNIFLHNKLFDNNSANIDCSKNIHDLPNNILIGIYLWCCNVFFLDLRKKNTSDENVLFLCTKTSYKHQCHKVNFAKWSKMRENEKTKENKNKGMCPKWFISFCIHTIHSKHKILIFDDWNWEQSYVLTK